MEESRQQMYGGAGRLWWEDRLDLGLPRIKHKDPGLPFQWPPDLPPGSACEKTQGDSSWGPRDSGPTMMLQRGSGSRLNLPFSCLGDRASEDPCQQIGRARTIGLGAAQQGGSAPPPTLSLGFMRISTSWSHSFTSWSLGCPV